MKHILLFAGGDYDRCGGMHDYHSAYDDLQDAFVAGDALMGTENENGTTFDWYHILDTNNPDGYYSNTDHKRNPIQTTNQ